MDGSLSALLTSWSLLPELLVPLLLVALVYYRGWRRLQSRGSWHPTRTHLVCFLAGLSSIYLALASPLDPFGFLLLQVHMLQHLVLMFVAPPLLWLGAPAMPLLMGLSAPIRRDWVNPLFGSRPVQASLALLTRPAVAWTIFVVVLWTWHLPQLYDLALRSWNVHYLEHACFFWTGVLFWWPVIQPYPAREKVSPWKLLPYLFLAGIQGTVLSAILTFAPRVLYGQYSQAPRLWGISALVDQALAGAYMWVGGSIAYLVPLVWIGSKALYGRPQPAARPHRAGGVEVAVRRVPRRQRRTGPIDVMRLSVLGRYFTWRHSRALMQFPLLLLAGVMIYDGLTGPQVAPMNLAGVLPWVHWRAVIVSGLLVALNVCCMSCPFMLPRALVKRWLPTRRPWPRWLPGKWPAVVLVIVFLWAYEVFSLWNDPWLTAWVALAYFGGAVLVDAFFQGASFCKHLCPVGQFNFVLSVMSPLEIGPRDRGVCARCETKDCIHGRGDLPGCGTYLFQPTKSGNMDCNFCLDCAHACPFDNVGLFGTVPTTQLIGDPLRGGIGHFSRRTDLVALVAVICFGAWVNAAGMIAPVFHLEAFLIKSWGLTSRAPLATAAIVLGLVVLPAVVLPAAGELSRRLGRVELPWPDLARRFTYTLVPVAFGMWLAHYTFHLVTGAGSALTAGARFLRDLGWRDLPVAPGSCCTGMPPGNGLLIVELLLLDLGLLGSLYVAYRNSRLVAPRLSRAVRVFAPWAVLIVMLFLVGVWILFQPMQMRGTMMAEPGGM